MPSLKIAGKSKADLVAIAQIAGLLTAQEAKKMTKPQLVSFLEAENARTETLNMNSQPTGTNTKSDLEPDKVAAEPKKKATRQPTRKKTAVKTEKQPSVTRTTRPRKTQPDASAETAEKTVIKDEKGADLPVDRGQLREVSQPAEKTAAPKPARRGRRPKIKQLDKTTGSSSQDRSEVTKTASKVESASNQQTATEPMAEETSPEGMEAALEKEPAEKAGEMKKADGSTRHLSSEFPSPLTRVPRSRISTRQIRPADEAAEEQPKEGSDVSTDETAGLAGDKKTDAVTVKENEADKKTHSEPSEIQGGVLEIMPDGYGFLRKDNYLQGSKDIYVPPQYIRRFGLRPGDYINGPVRLQRESDRYQALLYIKDVNGLPPEKMLRRPHFGRLTPIYPDERFVLETTRNELSTRIIDLVAPIGKGQRGMIVSPPKAGKTILLQKIANAVSINNPDTKLIVLLIDERPEEVTDMQRSIRGEVVYSTFDKTPENHTKVVELVLERAMRLVELKQDVMILLDSMTRLARAYNLTINPTGRTLSGGLDPGALYGPKRFFGAARNIENGGSLTIIATSLIETGSRMDEVIFEEFKGTGNMEVYLDRKLSEKRIFPAIDINKSGTRREELLMDNRELDAVWTIRKAFSQLDTSAVTEAIINLLLKTKSNDHFISSVNVSFNDKNVFDAMRGTQPGGAQQSGGTGGGYSGNTYSTPGYTNQYRRNGNN